MEIWCSIVKRNDGGMDVEFLNEEPTESFRDGLWDALTSGDIQYWEIRMGYLNGGDSLVEYSSHG